MTDRTLPVTEDELHAYLDGELPGDRIAGVEAWLAAHPDDMAKVAAWRAQSDAIRARYGSVADETVPTRFDLDQMMKADRSWRKPAAAAAVIAFVLGGALGWFAHTPVMSAVNQNTKGFETFTTEAVEAYKLYVVEVRHPVEVTANDAEHLVQWLSKRVARTDRRRGFLHVRERNRRTLYALFGPLQRARNRAALRRQRSCTSSLLGDERCRLCHQRTG